MTKRFRRIAARPYFDEACWQVGYEFEGTSDLKFCVVEMDDTVPTGCRFHSLDAVEEIEDVVS